LVRLQGTNRARIGLGRWAAKSDTDANVPQFNTLSNTVVAGVGRILTRISDFAVVPYSLHHSSRSDLHAFRRD